MYRQLFLAASLFLHTCCMAQSENPLFNTFKTGTPKGGSNNNAVAIVKSAIGTFGVNNVFRYVNTDDGAKKYFVRLRNDENLVLSFEELQEARAYCCFTEKARDILSADIRKYAVFCFAVMAKKMQRENPAYTYMAAINAINDNYGLAETAALLGLRLKPLKPCTVNNLAGYNHIIVCSQFYTAYANMGYYDETGNSPGMSLLADFRHNHPGNNCLFGRCNINEAFRIDE